MDIPGLEKLNALIDQIPLFKLDTILIVCIEEKCIKMIELGIASSRPEIKNYAIVKLAVDDTVDDPMEVIVDTISSASEKGGFTTKNLFALVMGGSVFLKKITLPKIPKAELDEAVRWEATNHIPFNVDTAYFDWEFLSTVKAREGVANNEYMIAATDKSAVDFLIDVYEKLGMKLICIGLPAFALKNFVQGSAQFEIDKGTAVVDVGVRKTNIVVFRGKQLVFAREVPTGLDALDDILRGELHGEIGELSPDYVDSYLQMIKTKYDFFGDFPPEEEIIKGINNQRIFGAFHTFIERLVSEMRRSFDYVKSSLGNDGVSKIVLSGSGSQLISVDRQIEQSFSIPTEIISSKGMFLFDESTDKETFASLFQDMVLAIGCGMGRLAQINFMPYSFVEERRNKIYSVLLLALFVVNIFLGVFGTVVYSIKNMGLRRTLMTEGAKVEKVLPQIVDLQRLCDNYRNQRSVYDVISDERAYLANVLSELTLIMPETISLNKVTLTRKMLVLEGFVFEDEAGVYTKENVLVDFIIALNESGYVNQASLALSETGDGFDVDHNRFVVNCMLRSRKDVNTKK